MNLLLPPEIVARMIDALKQAGKREIGGIMMGEHIGSDTFRVKEITIQRKGGTFAAFVRVVEEIVGPLRSFFRATNRNYTRFNYLGEWHSHHSFRLTPSTQDDVTMSEIVMEPGFGAHFVALLLVKMNSSEMEASVTVYRPNAAPYTGKVMQEGLSVNSSITL